MTSINILLDLKLNYTLPYITEDDIAARFSQWYENAQVSALDLCYNYN